MGSERFKQIYSLVLLGVTVLWAAFSVLITYQAVAEKQTVDILAASGASVLLGILAKMLSDVNQYFFRKRPSQPPGETKE